MGDHDIAFWFSSAPPIVRLEGKIGRITERCAGSRISNSIYDIMLCGAPEIRVKIMIYLIIMEFGGSKKVFVRLLSRRYGELVSNRGIHQR